MMRRITVSAEEPFKAVVLEPARTTHEYKLSRARITRYFNYECGCVLVKDREAHYNAFTLTPHPSTAHSHTPPHIALTNTAVEI